VDGAGADYTSPEGSFYVLARFDDFPGTLANVERLVDEAGVAGMPDEAFGTSKADWLRFALVTPRIEEAASRAATAWLAHSHVRSETTGGSVPASHFNLYRRTYPGRRRSDGMSELSVEAVESLSDEVHVDAPEYVLYGGKGGVGKTTMAAATALASAREGTATLAVSTDPAHSLSDSLGVDVSSEPERIDDEYPLYGVEIDPERMDGGPFAGGEEGADGGAGPMGAGGMAGMEGLLGEDGPLGGDEDGPMGAGGMGTMPGADEAAAMQLLLRYMDDARFGRVVVDTAPTGHTLRLLELPEMMDSMMGRMLKLRERFSGMMDSVKGMFGANTDPEAGMADLQAMADRIERLRGALRDPTRTDFRVVMVPEEMSATESERLVSRLGEFEVPVSTLVVNRVMQDLADVTGVETEWFVAPDLEGCDFCKRRWDVQRGALSQAQDLFRGREVKRVPLFADEVRGEEMLRVVAACLE
jgi:arsenite-transporting ATPase